MGGLSRVLLVLGGGAEGGADVVDEGEGVDWDEDAEALLVGGTGSVLVEAVVSAEVVLSSSVVSLGSGVGDMPRRVLISSSRRPLDCKKVTLRSVGASRMESSSRNLAACSMSADREVSSDVGDEVEAVSLLEELLGCCH